MATTIEQPSQQPAQAAEKEAHWYDAAGDMLASRLPDAVKGFGFARPGGNKPLDDDNEIFDRSFKVGQALKSSVRRSHTNPAEVMKGINPGFTNQFGMFNTAMTAPGFGIGGGMNLSQFASDVREALGELGKNITLTSPLASSSFGSAGFVPYDLVSP